MQIQVTLKEYLARQKRLERAKPARERRRVPSIVELAEAIDIHPMTLSNIANNNIVRFNLATGAAILEELRRRGFRVEASDLLTYPSAEEAGSQATED